MKVSRRSVLKITSVAVLMFGLLPRTALAGRNSILSLRTGVQPGKKTRLVIETSQKPSYTISYAENKLFVTIKSSTSDACSSPKIATDGLVKNIETIIENGNVKICANLKKNIGPIPENQIMLLDPNGDNDYRLVLDFVAGNAVSATATNTEQPISAKKYTIVIDAGHGGKDPGCIGKNGTKEKVVVLSVAKKLKSALETNGFNTFLTRTGDSFLKLADRAEFAEKKKADLFISLHANANPSRSMKGFSVYTLSEKASDEEAQKLADAENAADKIDVDGFEQFSKDIRIALSALQQHAVAELSAEYATTCSSVLKSTGITRQGNSVVRHAPFAVLRSTVPGALIELGHLSNTSEEKLLKSDDYQNKLVSAIVKSIKKYDFDV